jgi:hypothetical protein
MKVGWANRSMSILQQVHFAINIQWNPCHNLGWGLRLAIDGQLKAAIRNECNHFRSLFAKLYSGLV